MVRARMSMEIGDKALKYVDILDKRINYKRSKVNVSIDNDQIVVDIDAEDPAALVASMGSVLRQLGIISDVDWLVEKGTGRKTGQR